MRLRHIEVFHAIYTTGSITAAANVLNVSQPSVSKVLRHAEDQLGFNLFDREKRGLVPTPEARKLYIEVQRVIGHVESLRQSARNLRDRKTTHLRISMITGLGFNVTPVAIARFRKDNPDVTFEVSTEHFPALLSSLLEHRTDIGLVFQPPSHPNIASIGLGRGEMVCMFKQGEFPDRNERIPIDEIASHSFISMTEQGPLGSILAGALREQQIELRPEIIAETGFVAANLGRVGLGVTIIDELTAAASMPGMEYAPLDPPVQFSVSGIYLKSDSLNITSRDFLRCFKQVYSEMTAGLRAR